MLPEFVVMRVEILVTSVVIPVAQLVALMSIPVHQLNGRNLFLSVGREVAQVEVGEEVPLSPRSHVTSTTLEREIALMVLHASFLTTRMASMILVVVVEEREMISSHLRKRNQSML